MAQQTIQVAAALDGVSSLRDGGLSVRFHTQELDEKEKALVMSWLQKFGWLLFSDNSKQEVPKEAATRDTGGKSPSQRLRSVIYVQYQQSNRTDLTFEEFYTREMEKHIDAVKKKLN